MKAIQETFHCAACGQDKPVHKDGGTGYGYNDKEETICYACCGERDKADMQANGKATLYLTMEQGKPAMVSNWPGTLKIEPHHIRVGRHNIAGKRYDAWFTGPDGNPWHGVTYGDNTQICHCKRIKS